MGGAGAEEHAIRHDDRRSTARLQQPNKQREKEQLRLFRFDDALQILGCVFIVERPGKRRIGQHQRVLFLLAGVVLGERVAALYIRIFDAMQQHVHAADAKHGVSEFEAVEEALVKVLCAASDRRKGSAWRSRRYSPVPTRNPQVPAAGSQSTSFGVGAVSSTMSRMMWRGVRNWPFVPAAGELAQHVLIHVALGVAVVHGNVVDQVHYFGQQRRRGDGEAGVAHVMRIGRAIRRVYAGMGRHAREIRSYICRGIGVLKSLPAVLLVGAALAVFAFGEDAPLQRFAEPRSLALLKLLQFVQAPEKKQIGDLFNDLNRVGDAARPEGVPDAVDLVANFSGKHGTDNYTGSVAGGIVRRAKPADIA